MEKIHMAKKPSVLTLRRALIIGAPLVLGVVELWHSLISCHSRRSAK